MFECNIGYLGKKMRPGGGPGTGRAGCRVTPCRLRAGLTGRVSRHAVQSLYSEPGNQRLFRRQIKRLLEVNEVRAMSSCSASCVAPLVPLASARDPCLPSGHAAAWTQGEAAAGGRARSAYRQLPSAERDLGGGNDQLSLGCERNAAT